MQTGNVARTRELQGRVPNCSGGLIQHIDGTIAGCTLDDEVDGCIGLEERHEDAPEICWERWGHCDREFIRPRRVLRTATPEGSLG
jgi:hypothetical protein